MNGFNGFRRLFAISAVAFVGLGVLLALAIIVGIWLEFESPVIWKCIGTIFVLFFLSGVVHAVAKAVCEIPKDKG
jgi:hypothetical protein